MQRLAKIFTQNLFITCSTSGKSTKQRAGEYFDNISESIGSTTPFLVLDNWSSQTDEGVCREKFDINMEIVFLLSETTKHLQSLHGQFFQDNKYFVKKIEKKTVKYSKTQWSICGDIDISMREVIKQICCLTYNEFSSPNFDEMRQYGFQEDLIKISCLPMS